MSRFKAQTTIRIDLGNSYSCVGVFDPNSQPGFKKVAIIPNEQGNRLTPSYVAFNDQFRLVGDAAKNQIASNPLNTVWNVKRFMGRRYDDKDLVLQEHDDFAKHHARFRVVEEHRRPVFEVKTQRMSTRFRPEEITAMIISKLKQTAETYLDHTVFQAVIPVPSRFNLAQRQAVMDSAQIAGLEFVRLTNSTDLAALAYIFDNKFEGGRNILVFDYGSYSLAVSALTLEGVVEVLSTHSSTLHCGEEFNNRLVNHFVREFNRKHRIDLTSSAHAMSRLRTACERVKCALSSSLQESLEIDSLFERIDFYTTITRTRFEELCHDLFQECLQYVERVLREERQGLVS